MGRSDRQQGAGRRWPPPPPYEHAKHRHGLKYWTGIALAALAVCGAIVSVTAYVVRTEFPSKDARKALQNSAANHVDILANARRITDMQEQYKALAAKNIDQQLGNIQGSLQALQRQQDQQQREQSQRMAQLTSRIDALLQSMPDRLDHRRR